MISFEIVLLNIIMFGLIYAVGKGIEYAFMYLANNFDEIMDKLPKR